MATPVKLELDKKLKKLKAKLENRCIRVRNMFSLSQDLDAPGNKKKFLAVAEKIETLMEEINENYDQVIELQLEKDFESPCDYSTLGDLQEKACFIEQARRSLLDEDAKASVSSNAVPISQLPKIVIPEFAGDAQKWPIFYDTFTSLIHSNPNIDNITKMYYLIGALKGKPLEMCSNIPPTSGNYKIIWDSLVAKYQNPRRLAETYLHSMIECRAMGSETATALESLLDRFDKSYRALQNLQLPDMTDFIVTDLILSKLDSSTRKQFEMSPHSKIPTYEEVFKFLSSHVGVLRVVKGAGSSENKLNGPERKWRNSQVFVTKDTESGQSVDKFQQRLCQVCRGPHATFTCSTFQKNSTVERWELVKKKSLCFNCLLPGHNWTNCNSKGRCRFCQKRHHSLLHTNAKDLVAVVDSDENKTKKDNVLENSGASGPNLCAVNSTSGSAIRSTVVLPTAVVLTSNSKNEDQSARFLIDTGSQSHLLTLNCCRRLKIPIKKFSGTVTGIGSVREKVLGQVNMVIKSKINPNDVWEMNALVVRKITERMPGSEVFSSQIRDLKKLQLADENFDCPGPIDGVLGAAFLPNILTKSVNYVQTSGLTAVSTRLGYIILGKACNLNRIEPEEEKIQTFCAFDDIGESLQKFWEMEEVHNSGNLLNDASEELFQKTTTRGPEGRYCVQLPFSEFPPQLGESFSIARRRFLNLEKHFEKSSSLRKKYCEGIKDYIAQGHLTEISFDLRSPSFFIPHFAVFKESNTTPVRIVFDASCKSSNGRSLNDFLLTGPKLQTNIQDVLIRFRLNRVAVVADIRQMYRNISVHPSHRCFQRILWRDNPNDKLRMFELTCVPFGLKPAPFLALRTVQQLAHDEEEKFPLASRIARTDMYVDDVVTSVPEDVADKLYPELSQFFMAGGFKLVKWATNSEKLAQAIPEQEQLTPSFKFKDLEQLCGIKVLGLNWGASCDMFFFSVNLKESQCTKRIILSTLAKIWDPLGFLAPVTLYCKILIKRLWLSACGWDEPPPADIKEKWLQFVREIPLLSKFQIPRFTGSLNHSSMLLVGFADSSEDGFGAVLYAVPRESSGKTPPKLLIAKSKVSPTKTCSIPRLELCAALLLAKLFNCVFNAINVNVANVKSSVIALSDSEVALQWISQSPHKWKTFVGNRVAKIQELLPTNCWWHVPGNSNVADQISRGLTPQQFSEFESWSQGPAWLKNEWSSWPISRVKLSDKTGEEKRVILVASVPLPKTNSINELILRCSSWLKLVRIFVFILRFGHRISSSGLITSADLEAAELTLVSFVQRTHFESEFVHLAKGSLCSTKLRPLKPFVDGQCLRVGGRLSNASLPYNQKHPLLLPKKDPVVNLLIDYYHRKYLHTGPGLLSAILRQKYWILSSRSVIRQRIKKCNFCFNCKPTPCAPPMADLPIARVSEAKAFLNCGVDYGGPFLITIGRYRGNRSQKAYLCLFVCLVTKAVHLELATDLSTAAFLNCFKRFVSRRGPVANVYSDCGTNFVGAKAELDNLHSFVLSDEYKKVIGCELAANKIQWHFNPPAAPHFGGLWEANVKSVKYHLKRVIGDQIVSSDELYTVLVQIESILNSRPLTWLSSDPNDPTPLTPAHFLTLGPLECSLVSEPKANLSVRDRKSLLDQLVKDFWVRWKEEYLTTLQCRTKWVSPDSPLQTGTVVLIKENTPPLQWSRGVVTALFPGKDGVARVAEVRTAKGVFRRPLVKLCPLPSQ